MSEQTVAVYLGYLWDAFALTWLVSALAVKRTTRAEPHWVALGRSLVLGALLYCLYAVPPPWHWLHLRIVPDAPWAHWAGLMIAVFAMLFSAWARLALGTNWSSRATIKEGHELIVRGPYRLVRNPIYTGIFFALVGSAVALGQVRHFLGLPLVLLVWWWKIANEQRILREQFGDEYVRYCREVKAFIPYVI
ncbi:MAG TPA: isoprenylcysteine carboxylmethyltransferase family protein [Candidatus Koribacter sp.]|jgi:protein-S-isoprenylcysteine O-methyltransferase Ste14